MSERYHVKIDPPSANEEYIQYRRQRLKKNENENCTKRYSTIRFSGEIEVYSKQPSSYCSGTPTKSILRKKGNGNNVSGKPSYRRKDTLLEKIIQIPQVQNDTGFSGKPEPPGPILPRQDWNIESLFCSSKERKKGNQQSLIRSRRVDPGGIPTRVSKIEQFYSSDYLLKKYAATPNDSPLANNGKLDVSFLPRLSSDSASIEVPSTPKASDNRRRRPFSDSKLTEKSTARRRLVRKGYKKELSYLQLEECHLNEENSDPDDLGFCVNGRCYDLCSFMDNPKSSTNFCDGLLVQNSTSDTQESDFAPTSGHNRFGLDILREDSPRQFDDKDFRISDSKRPRRTYKVWAVLVLVGTVFTCLASPLIVYLTVMDGGGDPSISTSNFRMGECINRDHSNRRFVSDRYDTIRHYLLFQFAGNATMMYQPGSPQHEALCWISEFDDYNIDVTDENEKAIVQRYSLAVMHFSMFGKRKHSDYDSSTLRDTDFLSAQHECDWYNIMCDQSRAVTVISLSNKSLSGNLPPEIGNFSSLSKFYQTEYRNTLMYPKNYDAHSPVSTNLFIDFIDLSLNQLTGIIPTSIALLTSLENLSLAFNEFETTIPTVLGRMSSLKSLNLRSSGFVQHIPTYLGYLSNLGTLW
jgi:hypothetical protein